MEEPQLKFRDLLVIPFFFFVEWSLWLLVKIGGAWTSYQMLHFLGEYNKKPTSVKGGEEK